MVYRIHWSTEEPDKICQKTFKIEGKHVTILDYFFLINLITWQECQQNLFHKLLKRCNITNWNWNPDSRDRQIAITEVNTSFQFLCHIIVYLRNFCVLRRILDVECSVNERDFSRKHNRKIVINFNGDSIKGICVNFHCWNVYSYTDSITNCR